GGARVDLIDVLLRVSAGEAVKLAVVAHGDVFEAVERSCAVAPGGRSHVRLDGARERVYDRQVTGDVGSYAGVGRLIDEQHYVAEGKGGRRGIELRGGGIRLGVVIRVARLGECAVE